MSNPKNGVGRRAVAGVVLAAAVAGAAGGPAGAANFDWVSDGAALAPGITPSVFLSDANVAQVDAFLATQPVKAIKIHDAGVSAATIKAIYDKYKIDYTLADFEGANMLGRTQALVAQIKQSAGTGAALSANQAFVSNYAFAPVPWDTTAPTAGGRHGEYLAAGVNMASPTLYPGGPDFRSPASGNSTAPNVRSALFTLPVQRFSTAQASRAPGQLHVAYVNRFNNFLNGDLDTDRNPSNGYRFETTDQLLSRGDFQAQVLHYRLRGASGVIGLDGGVVGYSQADFMTDISRGWDGAGDALRDLMADPSSKTATLDTTVKADGALKTSEQTGVVYSGTYSNTKGKFVLLVSNLDAKSHAVAVPTKVGGKAVSGTFVVEAGSHEILEFGATGTTWNLLSSQSVFADDNRAGVGVPEPTCVGVGVAGLGVMLGRRRRRAA